MTQRNTTHNDRIFEGKRTLTVTVTDGRVYRANIRRRNGREQIQSLYIKNSERGTWHRISLNASYWSRGTRDAVHQISEQLDR
jgi:hypothetical protein